jgi:hypothetical protein
VNKRLILALIIAGAALLAISAPVAAQFGGPGVEDPSFEFISSVGDSEHWHDFSSAFYSYTPELTTTIVTDASDGLSALQWDGITGRSGIEYLNYIGQWVYLESGSQTVSLDAKCTRCNSGADDISVRLYNSGYNNLAGDFHQLNNSYQTIETVLNVPEEGWYILSINNMGQGFSPENVSSVVVDNVSITGVHQVDPPTCAGTELLTDTTISAGGTLNVSANVGYEDMMVWAAVENDNFDGDYEDTDYAYIDLNVNGYEETFSSYFVTPYEQFYSPVVAGPNAVVEIENRHTSDLNVLSICAEDDALVYGPTCLNSSPELGDRYAWNESDGVEWEEMTFYLYSGDWITRNLELSPGTYQIEVRAKDLNSGGPGSALNLTLGGEGDYVDIPPSVVNRTVTATVETTGTYTLAVNASTSYLDPIAVQYVCLQGDYEGDTGDEPDPDPPDYDTCLNADPDVNYPTYWNELGTGVAWNGDYTTLAPSSSGVSLKSDYYTWLDAGNYRLAFEARASEAAVGFASAGTSYDHYFTLHDDGDWHTYTADFTVGSGYTSTMIFQRLTGSESVDLRWLCLTEVEGAGTIGNCINNDPDFDDDYEHWVTMGDNASIADSIATLDDGERVYESLATNSEDHYAVIVARSPTTSSLYVNWQGEQHSLYLPGGTWITGTVQLPIDPALGIPQQLEIEAGADDQTVDVVCLRRGSSTPGPEPDDDDYQLWRPLCDRDWTVQTAYTSTKPMMQIGQGREGMPVHNVFAGKTWQFTTDTVTMTDSASNVYTNCIALQHDDYLSIDLHSVYCGLGDFSDDVAAVPVEIARGEVLGWSGDTYGGNVWFGLVLDSGGASASLPLTGAWIDPMQSLSSKHPDCVPYHVRLPSTEECDGDDGNGTWIPAKNNETFPGTNIGQYIPWLGNKLYDTVAYPILCGLAVVINDLLSAMETALNAIIDALSPIFSFIYRVARLLSHLLERVIDLMTALVAYFREMTVLGRCTGDLVAYFVEAFTQAASAEKDIDALNPSNSVVASMGVMFSLLQSTIANIILLPVTGLIVAWGSWNLIPWGLRHLRKAFEKGD